MHWSSRRHQLAGIVAVLSITASAFAQGGRPPSLPDALRARIDTAVTTILEKSGGPSASIAVIQNGAIVYEQAYGTARVAANGRQAVPATTSMRYSIGSVSKQFTATAVLLLAEERKLSLDDRVARWFPDLPRARDVTVRQLLSMTAGYQDFWPQDYVFPAMLSRRDPQEIVAQWTQKPLDFEPGKSWGYSGTNYQIAGLIAERASGSPLMEFLRRRVFIPLGMTSVKNVDAAPLDISDAGAYLRNALGPLRPAPKEGPGWLFAAGGLAMTAHDLALWDLSLINRTILSPKSYQEMFTDSGPGYGLGVGLARVDGRRRLEHAGAVSGYLASNVVFPDARTAVVAFVNIYPGASNSVGGITTAIAGILFDRSPASDPDNSRAAGGMRLQADDVGALDRARRVFTGLQSGRIDRDLFTTNANAYFSAQTLLDFASSLGQCGEPTEFAQTGKGPRGGLMFRVYGVLCGGIPLDLSVATLPDGKMEQYIVARR